MCIDVKHLTLKQGNRVILDNINLHIHRGEKIGLIGPNGSGKTTLLKALAGLHAPASGNILLECQCLNSLKPENLAKEVSILLQDQPVDMPLTVRETIELASMTHDLNASVQPPELKTLIDICHLAPLINKPVSSLSGGERQRVFMAQALYQAPAILMLDEPSNHLDVRHIWQLLQYCSHQVETVIASYHDFNLATTMCDRLILLADHEVKADGPPESVLTEKNLRKFFNIHSEKLYDSNGSFWIKVNGAAA
ncbi:ABC transporter ATP-binding protein [Endozoicomonas atrinae]|uniref:ABC transporter ATP-binding protein n=1 Tax=Endozoicomonas atrinae TaxID=1333660 RepID=UPI000824C89D|nr:ABC transporter ATP-binding protein [Endozoicomonas atrinae]